MRMLIDTYTDVSAMLVEGISLHVEDILVCFVLSSLWNKINDKFCIWYALHPVYFVR